MPFTSRRSARTRPGPLRLGVGTSTGVFAESAFGHAFGARYDLPLPLDLYLWAAGAAVALSFVVAGYFLRADAHGGRPLELDLTATAIGHLATSAPVIHSLRALSLLLFVLVIASGLFGDQSPTASFAATFVWVIWWVGITYLSALLGNVWDAVNPWRAMHGYLARALALFRQPTRYYPERLGVWPAVVLFAVFAYLELVSSAGEQPRTLALLIIGYTLLVLAGAALYGESWLRRGEAFTVLFGILARFGVFRGAGPPVKRLVVRPPGLGLLSREPVSLSMAAFVILALTTVSFDGFIETPAWAAVVNWVAESRVLRPALVALQEQGWDLLELLKITALVVAYLLLALAYLFICGLVARLSGRGEGALETARAYVLSLVPIAIAYHLAHYLSYLLLAGQLIIPLASDPLGLGWDLFGTAGYRMDITVIGAKEVWYVSVAAIVVGHIIAVYLAHATALLRGTSARQAIVSQLPMLVLMVGYTMISLWILSQPIVEVE